MTTPTQEVKPEQQYIYQTDQQVSVNAFIEIEVDGEPVKFQVTSRYGASPDKITKTASAAIEAYKSLRTSYPKPANPAPRTVAESSERKSDGEGTYENPKSFKASSIIVTMNGGKEYFKVKSADNFPKFPVTIWNEVMEKAGIDPTKIDPKTGYDLTGYTAFYIVNEKGNPAKIIRLEDNPF